MSHLPTRNRFKIVSSRQKRRQLVTAVENFMNEVQMEFRSTETQSNTDECLSNHNIMDFPVRSASPPLLPDENHFHESTNIRNDLLGPDNSIRSPSESDDTIKNYSALPKKNDYNSTYQSSNFIESDEDKSLVGDFDWSLFDGVASYDDETSDQYEASVKETLIEWVLECNVARQHVSKLLKRLRSVARLHFLPIDSRTLMNSGREKIPLVTMEPGFYKHFNLENGLINMLLEMKKKNQTLPETLELIVNVDGIPLSKSSSSEFWPILVKIKGWDEIYVCGIYHGSKKPKDINHFLLAFKNDFVRIRDNGIQFQGSTLSVQMKGMCCDAPAASFVKNITTHNAYFGCRKCVTRGLWISNRITHHTQTKSGGRVTYPDVDAPLRTDLSFRNRVQIAHHHKDGRRSIVEEVLNDVVLDDIGDYMHSVCIGVHKKILTEWVSASFDKCRFTAVQNKSISNYIVGISSYIPNTFPRKHRPLTELPRWKATELRLDLLYICPVAYKPFLSNQRYEHLMLLHVAIKLLVNKDNCLLYADYAESLLKSYVSGCSFLYGPESITFNVHSLLHLANDVRQHGCLDEISSFPFENKLQKLKNLIRKSGKPLQQAVNRLSEIEKGRSIIALSHLSVDQTSIQSELTLCKPHSGGPVVYPHTRGQQFQSLSYRNIYLCTLSDAENCVFLSGCNNVLKIENFIKFEKRIYLVGRKFLKKEDMFKYPLPSSLINEFVVSDLSPTLECFPLQSVNCKAFRIPLSIECDEKYFVCPLVNHRLNFSTE